jgi:hypothetical protein
MDRDVGWLESHKDSSSNLTAMLKSPHDNWPTKCWENTYKVIEIKANNRE